MGDLLTFLVVGLLVGAVARLLMPGPDSIGILATIAVGIVGAVVGGYLWRELFGQTQGVEWIGSILAAMGVLWVYRRVSYRRRVF